MKTSFETTCSSLKMGKFGNEVKAKAKRLEAAFITLWKEQ